MKPAGSHLADALRRAEQAADQRLVLTEPGAAPTALVAVGPDAVAYLAAGRTGRVRVLAEGRRIEHLAAHHLPVPALRYADPRGDFLVLERVPEDPVGGLVYTQAVVATAQRLAALPSALPPGEVPVASRRPSRLGLPVRLARTIVSPVPLRAFRRLRAQVRLLPDALPAHGDLHPGNALWDARRQRIHLIDLELMGPAPVGADLCQLWCGLREPADRRVVLDALTTLPGARVEVLLPWIALRTLADVTAGQPHAAREAPAVEWALQMWDEAAALTGAGR